MWPLQLTKTLKKNVVFLKNWYVAANNTISSSKSLPWDINWGFQEFFLKGFNVIFSRALWVKLGAGMEVVVAEG